MTLRRAASIAVLAVLCAAAPAAADEERDSNGAVTAVMSYTPLPDLVSWRDVRVLVTRAGVPVLDEPLSLRNCAVPYCRPVGVTVRDLDADGEPEVLVDVFTGGAHCCTITQLLTWDGKGYRKREHDWLDAGYTLEDLDGDGRPELRSLDARFRYEFASFAASAFPVQIWQVDGGVFADVTGGYADLVRKDAARWFRIWRGRAGKKDREPFGALAAWAAEQELLGRRATLTRELRVARRRGWITRGMARSIERFLEATGYRRR